jgi:hypothetical protein
MNPEDGYAFSWAVQNRLDGRDLHWIKEEPARFQQEVIDLFLILRETRKKAEAVLSEKKI